MKNLTVIILLTISSQIKAKCHILQASGKLSDGFSRVIQSLSQCPQNPIQLKDNFNNSGFKLLPSMVANRGVHNPKKGSFSIFEEIVGFSPELALKISTSELYIGHFTKSKHAVVNLDHQPSQGKLIIEVIAWDYQKQYYNFFELIGQGQYAQWFYRGDSGDALIDNRNLKTGQPLNKHKMRCSACHNSGGPIMKELFPPHNDWWKVKRKLIFSPNQVSKDLGSYLRILRDASSFAKSVTLGIHRLNQSRSYRKLKTKLSLKQLLRPLFCTTEINIISSVSNTLHAPIKVSSQYWVNPLLGKKMITIPKNQYKYILDYYQFRFPETDHLDSDFPWLAPVKSYQNNLAIKQLISKKIITREFTSDVLAIDMKSPLFSKKRCGLLKYIPSTFQDWKLTFVRNLNDSKQKNAKELFENIINPERDKNYHRSQAALYINSVQKKVLSKKGLAQEILTLDKKRKSVFKDDISKNPRGQILEPGFRVIFPIKLK